VRIFSEVLGEFVYWVHDEQTAERLKRAPDYQGEVCYTLAELRELSGQGPELLRGIHPFKKTFGATLQKITKEGRASWLKAAGEQPVSHEIENAGRRAANLPLLNIKPEEEPTRHGQENAVVIEGVLEERPKTGRQWIEEAERLGEAAKQLAEKFLRDAAMRRRAEANTYPLCVCCIHYAGIGLCSRGRVPALVSQARHCPVREVRL
jgi:hypothetical protein